MLSFCPRATIFVTLFHRGIQNCLYFQADKFRHENRYGLRKATMKPLSILKKAVIHPLVPVLTEKRQFPRTPLHLPTEYLPVGAVKARLCHTINICEGGVLLCLPEKVRVGQKLKVEIYYYFEYALTSFEALGEVIWAEKLEDSKIEYRCALEFLDLALNDLENLRKFLRKIFY